MTAHRLCPRCGAPLAPGLAASTLRCASCGETVAVAAGRPAAAARGGRGDAAEQATRSSLRSRLGTIVDSLDQVAKATPDVRALRDLLVGIRAEVTSGCGPNGEPLDWLALSQQLSFAPRLLRRSSRDDLAAEVDRVRAAFDHLATYAARPRPGAAPAAAPSPAADAPVRGATHGVALSSATRGGDATDRPRRRAWAMVVVGLVVLAAAALWFARARQPSPADPVAVTPTPLPTTVAHQPQAISEEPPSDLEQFSTHVAAARAAVLSGEPRAAVPQLVAAGAIARDRAVLFEVAREAVVALTNAAQEAMNHDRWADADADLAAAVDLGAALDLATDEALAAALVRLTSTSWNTTVLRPDFAALETLVGRPVVVATAGGGARGRVAAVSATTLTLAAAASLSGGGLSSTTSVAVADITSITFAAPIDAKLTLAALDRATARRSRPGLVATPRPPEATPAQ